MYFTYLIEISWLDKIILPSQARIEKSTGGRGITLTLCSHKLQASSVHEYTSIISSFIQQIFVEHLPCVTYHEMSGQ